MKCVFVKNKFYTDYGMEYIQSRLKEEFILRGIDMEVSSLRFGYDENGNYDIDLDADFVIFWDKDVRLARAIEAKGIRVFNSASAMVACDDKELTYSVVSGHGINVPVTISAPLVYDVSKGIDNNFIDYIESRIGYPIIVKENIGSQGRQVYLANNRDELIKLNSDLMHTAHIYQQFVGNAGADIRTFVVGGKVVATVKRTNTTLFKSNVALGGNMTIAQVDSSFIDAAEKISALLGLDYGSVDFLDCEKPVFLEANSNAYFRGIEQVGYNIAGKLADYILEAVKC